MKMFEHAIAFELKKFLPFAPVLRGEGEKFFWFESLWQGQTFSSGQAAPVVIVEAK